MGSARERYYVTASLHFAHEKSMKFYNQHSILQKLIKYLEYINFCKALSGDLDYFLGGAGL